MKTIKINNVTDVPGNYTGIIKYFNGSKQWYLNGKLHRTNGPAIEFVNGHSDKQQYWYNNVFLDKDRIDFFNEELGFPIKTAIKLVYCFCQKSS